MMKRRRLTDENVEGFAKCDNTIDNNNFFCPDLISNDSTYLLDDVVPYHNLSYYSTAHSEHLEKFLAFLSAAGVSQIINFVEARILNCVTAIVNIEAFTTVGLARNILLVNDCSSLPQTSPVYRMNCLSRSKGKNYGQQQSLNVKEKSKNLLCYNVSLPKRRKRCQYHFQDRPNKVVDVRLFWLCLLATIMWMFLLLGTAETRVIERKDNSEQQPFSDFEKWLTAGNEENGKGGDPMKKLIDDFMKESRNNDENPHHTHNYQRRHHKRRNTELRSAIDTGVESSGIVVVKGDNRGRNTGAEEDDVIVKTNLGRIRGFRQKFGQYTLNTFFGVPYAIKPTGVRRFRIPEMMQPWEGELVATAPAKTCYYTIDTMFPQFPGAEMWNPPNDLDEDCLSMNIWVPADRHHDGTVLVWIYGGGFFSGSPSLDLYDGRVLAARQRAIVININYRLGAFGFLHFGDGSLAPGNMGLLDQQMALKWIYENIGHFGGDPRKVTLFGESAGAASASAHLFAPGSRDYFSKLILKSGTIFNNWATKSKDVMLDISLNLAQRLNCTETAVFANSVSAGVPKKLTAVAESIETVAHDDDEDDFLGDRRSRLALRQLIDGNDAAVERIIDCMSLVPAFNLQREANAISESFALPMTFAFVPIDDDANFFQGNLFDKLRRRDFKKDISVIMGTVKDEGTYWLPYYLHKYGFAFNHTVSAEDRHNQALIVESDYVRAFDAFLPYFGDSPLVRHALMHAYARVAPPPNNNYANHHHDTVAALSAVAVPTRQSTTVSAGSSVAGDRWRDGVARFLGDYFFTCALVDFADVLADNVYYAVYMYYFTKRSSANPWPKWMGVMHGYEIEYVFGMPLRVPQQYDPAEIETERQFSEKIMEFWGNFARTSEPVEYWPKYNRMTRKSLVLSDEIARGNSHRIYVDVHGKLCRLLDEAQSVAISRQNEYRSKYGTTAVHWSGSLAHARDSFASAISVGPNGKQFVNVASPRVRNSMDLRISLAVIVVVALIIRYRINS